MGLKMEDAQKEALWVEERCLKVIEDENKRWEIPEKDLGELKVDGRWQGSFAGPYLMWLMEDGLVEADSRDISDLEVAPGFRAG